MGDAEACAAAQAGQGSGTFAYQPVLVFDSAISFGFGMDGLRFEPALAALNRALRYVDGVYERAEAFVADSEAGLGGEGRPAAPRRCCR